MDALLSTRRLRTGLLGVLVLFGLNLAMLVYTWPWEVWPTYPLLLLGRYVQDWDAGLGAVLQYLASTWGRLIWLVVIGAGLLGGLRPRDLGIRWRGWREALAVTLIMALLQEGVLAGIRLATGPWQWHPGWEKITPASFLGLVVYLFLGVAFFEETFYRGLMVPQFYHPLAKRIPHRAPLLAILLSQVLFALSHYPHYNMPLPRPLGLAFLWLSGVLFALMWLRTGNLFIAMGWHGLMDFPLHFAATDPGVSEGVIFLIGLMVLLGWPRVQRYWAATRDG